MADNPKLIVTPAPHLKGRYSIPKIMYAVVLALIPELVFATYLFGPRALILTLIAVVSAAATEAAIQAIRKTPITALDGSAIITGMLLAFNLPPGVPYWMPVVGAFVGIAIGKQAFGGLGYNPLNPALIGRAFLMASWPVQMTTLWIPPKGGTLSGVAAVTTATPLNAFKLAAKVVHDPASGAEKISQAHQTIEGLYSGWQNMFWGKIGGCIGETSAALIILTGLILIIVRIVDWRIPVSYIGTVALLGWMLGGETGLFNGNVAFQLFTGGLMLGAFFMATDMVTSPITAKGRWIFGIGAGVLTVLIRRFGGYPEGVSYSILLMNITVPLIDRWTKPRTFGEVKKK